MTSSAPYRMQILDEEPDTPLGDPARANAVDPQALQAAQAALSKGAEMQRQTIGRIATLLTILNVRFLLLLALSAATALTWLILIDPGATIAKMILVAATDSLLVLPLVALYARKGGL